MKEAISQFREAMKEQGLHPEEIISDGKIHRFSSNGKPHVKAGWYVLLNDGPFLAGAFGNWRSGNGSIPWSEKAESSMSAVERNTFQAAMNETRRLREESLASVRDKAAKKASSIWEGAKAASVDHPYLKAKQVASYGVMTIRQSLVVPFRDEAGNISTLQFINPGGNKRFLTDGRKKGCFFEIPGAGSTIYMVEGYATGATVHEATGSTVIVCADAGNIAHVGEIIRRKYPEARITICADDDQWTDGNPGKNKARAAAAKIGATVTFPRFRDTTTKPTDFNDLHNLEGIEAVKHQVEGDHSGVVVYSLEHIYTQKIEERPIAKGFAHEEEQCVIHAKGGVGKSLLTLDFAMTLGSGAFSLWGKFPIPRYRSTLFVQSENGRLSINQRVIKKCQGNEAFIKGIGNIFFAGDGNSIQLVGHISDPSFRNKIHEAAKQTGEPIDIIVFDPLISYHDADEERQLPYADHP